MKKCVVPDVLKFTFSVVKKIANNSLKITQ